MSLNVAFIRTSTDEPGMPAVDWPAAAENVAMGGTSSAAPSGVHMVRLCAGEDCYVLIGATPTTSTGVRMPAGMVAHPKIQPGQTVEVVAAS